MNKNEAHLDSLIGPRRKELEAGKGALSLTFPRLDEVNNLGIGHLGVGDVGFGDCVAGGRHGSTGGGNTLESYVIPNW